MRQTLTASEIQSAIDANDGDIEKTAAQLLERGRDEKEAERDSILETLIARFRDIKVDIIHKFLQGLFLIFALFVDFFPDTLETNYSIQETLPKLIMQRRQNLVDNFLMEFPVCFAF